MTQINPLVGVQLYMGGTLEDVGQKAANLVRLTPLLATVPFHIPAGLALSYALVHACAQYGASGRQLGFLRSRLGQDLGERLVVRSSPLVSMPGLLDTVIDVPNRDTEALFAALKQVYDSWFSPQAAAFRRLYRISDDFRMGILIQDYVAPAEDTYAGVHFSRDPRTGSPEGVTEALAGQNGTALVGGTQTPEPGALPAVYCRDLQRTARHLEKALAGPLDIEFVIQGEELHVVQARPLRHLTPPAAAIVARDMVRDGLLTAAQGEALVNRRDSKSPWWLAVDTAAQPVLQGLGAVSGAVAGRVAITRGFGRESIYVGGYTDSRHVEQMLPCAGILTNTGGQTCHAAILAMQAGKPTVVGARFLLGETEIFLADGRVIAEGEWITIDGTTGAVYPGVEPITDQRRAIA